MNTSSVTVAGSAESLRKLRPWSITVATNVRKRPVVRRQAMSEATDKKAALNDVQNAFYSDVAKYITDVYGWFKALKEEDVPAVLEVIHLEWLERLEETE
ncbi:hypothetical protein [Streptomyces lasalocidi]|uniref:Uncharacterized protein n=1 Tax=Streptomyces lasalocidi TaxID=324833 RepID=A0A4U5WP67_STRLS|nr:hypothetical protein [Streptomyces lasalocidi]TKT03432.1 hypothetical protein E4U91_27295 [Streptomyces lasalocidi]